MSAREIIPFCEICTRVPADYEHSLYGPAGAVLDITAYCDDCHALVSQAVLDDLENRLDPNEHARVVKQAQTIVRERLRSELPLSQN